jgi:hypothetical protein
MTDLADLFSALSPAQKATFLSRVAHEATVYAREAYAGDYERPDGVILRNANEFVHRVTGYITHLLNGSEGEGQDAPVMAMIVHHSNLAGYESRLADWLRRSD